MPLLLPNIITDLSPFVKTVYDKFLYLSFIPGGSQNGVLTLPAGRPRSLPGLPGFRGDECGVGRYISKFLDSARRPLYMNEIDVFRVRT